MEEKKFITADNWTFSHFTSANLQAFIHLGAEPAATDSDQVNILYLLTVLKDPEGQVEELFQWEFAELHEAIAAINEKYGNWQLGDRSQGSGGCGSCEAH